MDDSISMTASDEFTAQVIMSEPENMRLRETLLQAAGYQRMDGDGLSIGGVFIGVVYGKFDPGNMISDFIIIDVAEGIEGPF